MIIQVPHEAMDCHATTWGSPPSQGTVNRGGGGASLNDLAVDGTLNTTNQPKINVH